MREFFVRYLFIAGVCGVLFQPGIAADTEPLYSGFNAPTGIAFDSMGSLYVSNWGSGTVERITSDGTRSTVMTGIASPAGIVFDSDDTLYVAAYSGDYIESLATNGMRKSVAEGLATPTGLCFAKSGLLMATNRASGELLAINLDSGEKQVIASSLSLPVGVTELSDGSFVVSQYGGRVTRVLADGEQIELGRTFSRPGVGIIAAGDDSVMAVDNGADVVRRVDLSGESEIVAENMTGSLVALGRDRAGRIYAGTWGSGNIYQFENRERSGEMTRYERGLAKLREVDGSAGEAVVDSLQDIAPEFAEYMIEFAFGDIYSRPGLSLQQRELAVVAALTALGNARPQLKVHLHATLNVGCTREEIKEVIMMMGVYSGFPAALNGLSAFKEVLQQE